MPYNNVVNIQGNNQYGSNGMNPYFMNQNNGYQPGYQPGFQSGYQPGYQPGAQNMGGMFHHNLQQLPPPIVEGRPIDLYQPQNNTGLKVYSLNPAVKQQNENTSEIIPGAYEARNESYGYRNNNFKGDL